MSSNRADFISTWLLESPRSIGKSADNYDHVSATIKDEIAGREKRNQKPSLISKNLYKIIAEDLYYWYQVDDHIQLGCIVERRHEGLAIKSIAKDPLLYGKPPFASDLYIAILKDTDKNLKLLSGEAMSDQGFGIWIKLLDLGHKISIYDANNPGKTFKTFSSSDEMKEYFKYDNFEHERYQYVLSETENHQNKIKNSFRDRRFRELSGI